MFNVKNKTKKRCSFRGVLLSLQHSASVASVCVYCTDCLLFSARSYTTTPSTANNRSAPEIMECGSTTPGKLRHWIKSSTRPYTKLVLTSWLALFSLWDNFSRRSIVSHPGLLNKTYSGKVTPGIYFALLLLNRYLSAG